MVNRLKSQLGGLKSKFPHTGSGFTGNPVCFSQSRLVALVKPQLLREEPKVFVENYLSIKSLPFFFGFFTANRDISDDGGDINFLRKRDGVPRDDIHVNFCDSNLLELYYANDLY